MADLDVAHRDAGQALSASRQHEPGLRRDAVRPDCDPRAVRFEGVGLDDLDRLEPAIELDLLATDLRRAFAGQRRGFEAVCPRRGRVWGDPEVHLDPVVSQVR